MEDIKATRVQGEIDREFEIGWVSPERGEDIGRLSRTSGGDNGNSYLLPNVLLSANSYEPPEDYRRRQQERKDNIKVEILRYQSNLTPWEERKLAAAYGLRDKKVQLLRGSSRTNPIVLDTDTIEPSSSVTPPNSTQLADLSMNNDSSLIRQEETEEDFRMEDVPVERGDGVSTRREEDKHPDREVNVYSPEMDPENFNSEDMHCNEYDMPHEQNEDTHSGQEHGELLEENVGEEDTHLPPPSPMSTWSHITTPGAPSSSASNKSPSRFVPFASSPLPSSPMSTLSHITTPGASPFSTHSPSPSVRFVSPPAPVLTPAQQLQAAKRRDADARRAASRAQNTARILVLRAITHRTNAEENELAYMTGRREAARLRWRKHRDEERQARQGNEAAQHPHNETQMEIRRLRRTIATLKKDNKEDAEVAEEMYLELETEKDERIQQLEEEGELELEIAEETCMEMLEEKDERIRELEAEVEYWEGIAREVEKEKEE
ncbi:hypothetical protein MMC14_003591 [Varicellaria rhodocarpa]|nr:hypothetical protein [Varicellaria rhodocarpa]